MYENKMSELRYLYESMRSIIVQIQHDLINTGHYDVAAVVGETFTRLSLLQHKIESISEELKKLEKAQQ